MYNICVDLTDGDYKIFTYLFHLYSNFTCIHASEKSSYNTVHANTVYDGTNRTVYLFILPKLTELHITYAMNIDLIHISIYRKYGLVLINLLCTKV